jgi:thioredoxin reductase (NADPH)
MQQVTELEHDGGELSVVLSESGPVAARAVLLATGVSYRRLGIPALEDLNGAGVYYGGAASEAQGVVGRDVYIVGGANSAGQAALHLARYAAHVTLVVRAESLRAGMSHYLVQQVEADPNVEVRLQTEVVDGGGNLRLEHLTLRNDAAGSEETVRADALFLMIGARPHTEWLPDTIRRDEQGFVLCGPDLADHDWSHDRGPFLFETSMRGVFAAATFATARSNASHPPSVRGRSPSSCCTSSSPPTSSLRSGDRETSRRRSRPSDVTRSTVDRRRPVARRAGPART